MEQTDSKRNKGGWLCIAIGIFTFASGFIPLVMAVELPEVSAKIITGVSFVLVYMISIYIIVQGIKFLDDGLAVCTCFLMAAVFSLLAVMLVFMQKNAPVLFWTTGNITIALLFCQSWIAIKQGGDILLKEEASKEGVHL